MTIRDAANNPLIAGFTGQVFTVSAPADNGMYDPQFPVTPAATNTSGGRGGTIYRINTLADNLNAPTAVGDGTFRCSLRRALETQTGPRIIVFEVSGYFNNNDEPIKILDGNVTVAGQTAPSPGVCCQNEGIQILDDNVVFQHFSSRPGNFGGAVIPQTSRRDAFLVWSNFHTCRNVIMDHCSATWAPGKNMNWVNTPFANTLVWRCLNGEALYRPTNVIVDPGQPSSLAMLIGSTGADQHDVIQCIYANNSDRNPEPHEGVRLNWINNIVSNWGFDATAYPQAMLLYTVAGVAQDPMLINVVGSKYISGPSFNPSFPPAYAIFAYAYWAGTQVYMDDITLDQTIRAITQFGFNPAMGFDPTVFSPAISLPTGYSPLSSGTMQTFLINNVGARPLDRSPIDTRILNTVINRNGTTPSSQNDVGGYPAMALNNRVFPAPSNPNGISPTRGSPFTIMEDTLAQYKRDLEP